MGLNPSNGIAARDNPGKTMFPNTARRRDNMSQEEFEELDKIIEAELTQAGIKIFKIEPFRKSNGEVPTAVMGELSHWGFKRAWYYWVAEGRGIPPQIAEEFHQEFGKQVRVMGDCTCPSPLASLHGFAPDLYHIDTQEGLNAFASLLRKIDSREDEMFAKKCIVQGCPNYSDAGIMVGDLCLPCHTFLTTGKGKKSIMRERIPSLTED